MGSDATVTQFRCDLCWARYRWKEQWAGKKVRCKCGEVMVCPAGPEEEVYDVAPVVMRTKTAAKGSREAAGTQAMTGAVVAYCAPSTAASGKGAAFSDRTIDLHLPLCLIIGGVLIQGGAVILSALYSWTSIDRSLMRFGYRVGIEPAIMMVGIFIAAHFRRIDFGDRRVAIMKLLAITLTPGAVGLLLLPLAMFIPIVGGLGVWAVEFGLYFALIGAMFSLDESDTWYCVGVFFVLDVAAYFLLAWMGF